MRSDQAPLWLEHKFLYEGEATKVTNLFVSGMFRSGTTLVSMMLHSHKNIVCANDPYLPIFKAFRNKVADSISHRGNPTRPFDHYYYNAADIQLMEAIDSTDLSLPLAPRELDEIRTRVREYAREFSPRIADNVDRLSGSSFGELVQSAFDLVSTVSNKKGYEISAFKTAWTDEFVQHVLKADPFAKAIHVVRDPRAVCASKNARPDKYPWLFLIRHWRKLSVIAWHNCIADEALVGRVLLLHYEDIIEKPYLIAREICKFLCIEFDESMIKYEGFRDPTQKQWRGNSSYVSEMAGFDQTLISRWRNVLAESEKTFIELTCFPEMALHGYRAECIDDGFPVELVLSPPQISDQSLAKWIRVFQSDYESNVAEVAIEKVRFDVTKHNIPLSEAAEKALFLKPGLRRAALEKLQSA
jgi:hypothetical protein